MGMRRSRAMLAVAVLLTACGGTQSYDSAEALASDVGCTNFHLNKGVLFVKEEGSCDFQGEGLTIDILPEGSSGDEFAKLAGQFGGNPVVGPNWIVTADTHDRAVAVADKIGGEVK